MKIHDCTQGSLAWLELRAGLPTASEMDALVSPTFKVKKGDGLRYECESWDSNALAWKLHSFQNHEIRRDPR